MKQEKRLSEIIMEEADKFDGKVKNQLIVLEAIRSKDNGFNVTTIFKKDGTKFAYFGHDQKQPRYGSKHIVLNCFAYLLEWHREQIPAYLHSPI